MSMYFMINQTMKVKLCQNIKRFQYNDSLAIMGAIKVTSQIKFYNELGLESLKFRHWFRKLCLFCKIKKHGLPKYV